ncbi:phosphotransferase [Candidatus Uhrbacteria bacterium]|nr:phosphotransferase [Candidatus Uhrbacteria bacterium]
MSYPRHRTPIDFDQMSETLVDLFGCDRVEEYVSVRKGMLGENHRVNTAVGPFFLKRYRERISTVVHEIKMAETYFFENGLPVIIPIRDRFGREAFWLDECWYSLYPFIDGESPSRAQMTPDLLRSMGAQLAMLHVAGDRFFHRPFQMIRIGNALKLHMELTELRYHILKKSSPTPQEQEIIETLNLKEQTSQTLQTIPSSVHLTYDTLLHGDYQHFNLFANINRVTHLFDLERTALGPSAYELVRAIFLDCFEDCWEEKNFQDARLYLEAYREIHPITFEPFLAATHLYLFNMVHNTWLEASLVIYDSDTLIGALQNQVKRIQYLLQSGPEEFARRVWNKKIGW